MIQAALLRVSIVILGWETRLCEGARQISPSAEPCEDICASAVIVAISWSAWKTKVTGIRQLRKMHTDKGYLSIFKLKNSKRYAPSLNPFCLWIG